MEDMSMNKAPAQAKGRSPYLLWSIWVIWLPFTIPALSGLVQEHPTWQHYVLTLAGLALFVGLYLWATLDSARRLVTPGIPARPRLLQLWWPVVLMIALCLLMVMLDGNAWGCLFIF